tara:strand:+ start:637 stop:810 length:174 start_codon:yes stop_codon:yes gene_type:complete
LKPNKKAEMKRLHKMKIGVERESQLEQGYFDGRFVEKVEKSQKQYSRKQKHKNEDWE